jgi:hypothetical protein|tara:strand:- start:1074 stop:2096 length:1023 start_codon:yes stop_codon:yes gene_type:complete
MKVVKELIGYIVHFVTSEGYAFLSRNRTIYRYHILENKIDRIISLTYTAGYKNFIRSSALNRLLRLGIHHVMVLEDNSLLIFFDRRILKVKNNEIVAEYKLESGTRPLNVCYNTEDKTILWGEYLRSKKSACIRIFRSIDLGDSWEVVYTFSLGQVRHIHNIVYDVFRKHYWVLTGDSDEESGIWMTEDFSKLHPYLIGSQKFRAVSIIPIKDGLIIPTDTASERNVIQLYHHDTGKLERMQELRGSAFYATEVNGHRFVSTVYEPSPVNTDKVADLWNCRNGNNWVKLLSARKDNFPVKYFRYPIIKIPVYEDKFELDCYCFSVRSVKGGTRTLIIRDS